MTTRISKAIDGDYTAQSEGGCNASILTFQECFHAAASLFAAGDSNHTFVKTTVSDANQPAGTNHTSVTPTPVIHEHMTVGNIN